MRFVPLFALALSALFVAPSAHAGRSNPDEVETSAPKRKKAAKSDDKDKKKDKPFDEVIADFDVIDGLFTFYRDDDEGTVYLEILPDQLDTLFMCSVTREAGDGSYYDSASMMGEFPFVLRRVGKKVQFVHKNVYFRAAEGASLASAIGRGVSDSIVGTGKIVAAPHTERGSLLVDVSGFFIQDHGGVTQSFARRKTGAKYKFDKDNSYFGVIKSFPNNSEIQVRAHFTSSNPSGGPTLADARSFLHLYHYSLSSLPQSDFRPRIADDRVGHFLTMHQDYSSTLTETAYVRYVNRWNLQKAEPRLELSPPRRPIVYWLENTIPVAFRDSVREGVLLWNKAFERIGFKDAIVVKQQPDDADWDAADSRYSTIRWMVNPGGSYAVGPSRTNPFTGELYDADIRVSADMIRRVMLNYDEVAETVARDARLAGMFDEENPSPPWAMNGRYGCDHADGLAEHAAFGFGLIQARGVDPLSAEGEAYIRGFIVDLIAHEVGHTLGLRHNFKASTVHSLSALQKASVTSRRGLTSSVMDYTPVNLASDSQTQGEFFNTTVGEYDIWAIEYAYKPIDASSPEGERAELDRIASRAAEPALAYGTDEDAWGGAQGMDPTSTRWDLGDDSIDYYRTRVDLARELWSKMEGQFERDGERYQKMRLVFGRALGQISASVTNVCKYIGGVYHRRDHVGDPGGRLPFEPVAAARQREALAFLGQHVFGQSSFVYDPKLLNKLAPERLPDFDGSTWKSQRLDYPLHDRVLRIQQRALAHLYDGILLSRVLDNELRFDAGDGFTMARLFSDLQGAIWAELDNPGNVPSMRRALQRAHLERLVSLVVKPAPGTPADASALARADLSALEGKMQRALGRGGLDAYTSAHLAEGRAVIQAALAAGIERRLN